MAKKKQNTQTIPCSDDTEQQEILDTTHRNTKWYSHSGKVGSFILS